MMNQPPSLPLKPESGPLPWQRGWNTLRSLWPQLLYISISLIAIPQCLLYWSQSLAAAEAGRIFDLDAAIPLISVLERLKHFSLHYSLLALAMTGLVTIGYFSIITLTIQTKGGLNPKSARAVKAGIKVFFPRRWVNIPCLIGVAILAGSALFLAPSLGIIGQYIAISLLVLLAALPVLLAVNPASFLESFRSAMSLGYVKDTGVTRWTVFFVLLTYQMALIGIISLIKHGQEWLLGIDSNLHLSRGMWLHLAPQWPFGALPLVVEVLSNVTIATVLGAFAVFTSSFIVDLMQSRVEHTLRPRHSVLV